LITANRPITVNPTSKKEEETQEAMAALFLISIP